MSDTHIDIGCNNSGAFNFYGAEQVLFVIMSMHILVLLVIMILMIRLCTKAFSYSNFHILQSYKLYILLFIATLFIILARFCEYQTIKYKALLKSEKGQQMDKVLFEGWVILNSIITTASYFLMNQAYVHYGFTWLMITLDCDFTIAQSFDMREIEQHLLDISEQLIDKMKKIKKTKRIVEYIIMPSIAFVGIMLMPMLEKYCIVSEVLIIISSMIAMIIICIPFGILLKKRWGDLITPKKTKILWVYLALTMIIRLLILCSLLIVGFTQSKDQTDIIPDIVSSNVIFLIYGIVFTNAPILATIYLAQKQLTNEKCSFLKGSSAMVFGSVLM